MYDEVNMKKVQVYLPPDLIQKVDTWSKNNGMNRGQAVRFMIYSYLKQTEQKELTTNILKSFHDTSKP